MRWALVLLATTSVAHADIRDMAELDAAGWLHYELTGLHAIDTTARAEDTAPRARELVLAGVRLHAMASHSSTVEYHIGLDLAAGGTARDGGFAYDVALFPVGVGARFGRTSYFAVGLGIGALGATGTIDDALTIPLEATGELGGGRVRVLARARASYIAGADARQSAAPSIAFADELDTMIGLRIGHHYEDYDFPTGNGYFVGFAYRELAGVRFAGLTIGYSIDAGTPRKDPDERVTRRRPRRRRA